MEIWTVGVTVMLAVAMFEIWTVEIWTFGMTVMLVVAMVGVEG